MIKKNRIAIFQYRHPIQVHTKNIVEYLSEHGYRVSLFLYKIDHNFSKIEINKNKNLKIYQVKKDISIKNFIIKKYKYIINLIIPNLFIKYFKKNKKVNIYRAKWVYSIIQHNSIMYAKKIIECNLEEYICSIGIEKLGMIWAGKIKEHLNIPYIYYSLELYTFVEKNDNPYIQILLKNEHKYHQKAQCTIIQDNDRKESLYKFNNIINSDTVFLPISIRGKSIHKKSNFLHSKFDIPKEKKIILVFGFIYRQRLCDQIINQYINLNEDYVLVFHGPTDDTLATKKNKNVYFSNILVQEEMIKEVISSSHIGLVIYSQETENERLTAFSSEKIAWYMKCGIPIIAFENDSYRKLFSEIKIGLLIKEINEIPETILKIDSQYNKFRQNCFSAFQNFYTFDKNCLRLTEYINNNFPPKDSLHL